MNMDDNSNPIAEGVLSAEEVGSSKKKIFFIGAGVVIFVAAIILSYFYSGQLGASVLKMGGVRTTVQQGQALTLVTPNGKGIAYKRIEICSTVNNKETCKVLGLNFKTTNANIVIPIKYALGKAYLQVLGFTKEGERTILAKKALLIKKGSPAASNNGGGGGGGGGNDGGGGGSDSDGSNNDYISTPIPSPIAGKYWIGPSGGSFSDAANWASLSGGQHTSETAPGPDDIAVFDGAGNTNCTMDGDNPINVKGLYTMPSYSAAITQSQDVTIGQSGFYLAGGSYVASTDWLYINGDWFCSASFVPKYAYVTFTKESGTQIISGNCAFDGLDHTGKGVLKLNNDIDVNGHFENQGIFDTNGKNQNYALDLKLTEGSTYIKGGVLTFDGLYHSEFKDDNNNKQNLGVVRLAKDSRDPLILLSDMVVDTMKIGPINDVKIGGFELKLANNGAIQNVFEIVPTGTLTSDASGIVQFDATNSNGNVIIPVAKYANLMFTGTETYELAGSLTGDYGVRNFLVIGNNATLDVGEGNRDITTGSWFTLNGGNFIPRLGTVAIQGNEISGSVHFNNLTIATASTKTFSISPSEVVIVVGGKLTLEGTSGHMLLLRSGASGVPWSISSTGTQSLQYLDIKDSVANPSLVCGSTCIDSGNNTGWTFGSL